MRQAVAGMLLTVCGTIFAQPPQAVRATETPLQQIVQLAAAAQVPLGLLLGQDRSLCEPAVHSAEGSDKKAELLAIAREHQLMVEDTGSLLLSSTRRGSGRLDEALNHSYEKFPSLSGTMSYMGAVLNGWMYSYTHPDRGFGMSWGSSTDAEQLVSPAMADTSLEQVANHIVTLGHKGLWIAEESASPADERQINFRIFSYHDDLQALQRISCTGLPAK